MTRYGEVLRQLKTRIDVTPKDAYKSLALLERIDTNSVSPPKAQHDVEIRMPEFDMANIAKERENGEVWVCGDFLECNIRFNSSLRGVAPIIDNGIGGNKQHEDYVRKSELRAKRNVRRICNSARCRIMWTLTLALPSQRNNSRYKTVPREIQTNRRAVLMLWKAFLRRFYRKGITFQWLLVTELHDSDRTSEQKRGTWHLHFATPDRIPGELVWAFWPHGNVKFTVFRGSKDNNIDNPGEYLSKYVGKSFGKETAGTRRYSCSRNIKRPKKISLESFRVFIFYRPVEEYKRYEQRDSNDNIYGISITYKVKETT